MNPRRTIRLLWTFYTSFVIVSLIITAICLSIFWKYGVSTFFALFWFKLATLAITFYFINSYKAKEYYYYQNLGISKVLLWSATLSFDFAFFLSLLIQTFRFR